MNNLLTRITQTSGQCGGCPCIRGMRIRVSDILEMLAERDSGEPHAYFSIEPNYLRYDREK